MALFFLANVLPGHNIWFAIVTPSNARYAVCTGCLFLLTHIAHHFYPVYYPLGMDTQVILIRIKKCFYVGWVEPFDVLRTDYTKPNNE